MKVSFFPHSNSEHGVAIVEAAMTIGLFFLIIGGTIDFCRALHTEMTMRYALNIAGRWSVLGKSAPGAVGKCDSSDSGCWRAQTIEQMVHDTVKNLGVNDEPMQVSVCPIDASWNCAVNGNYAGKPEAIVELTGEYPFRLYFVGKQIKLTSTIHVRNEPA